MKLAGNVALVTGWGRRMGRAIALAFAANGANVVINAVSDRAAMQQTVADARALGVRAIGCLADVRDRAAVDAMVTQARAELAGPIDILVNCPAPRAEGPFETLPFETWREVMSIVLDGAFHCTQAVIPGMLEAGRGTILSITGLGGQTGQEHRAHVAAAKHGLAGMTKSLAMEYAARGITVNAIAPTRIAGGASRASYEVTPVGRTGRQEEVAALCCFLASEDARFITGQTYAINGGTYI